MNANLYNTTDYKNKSNWTLGENKPNSNPIKPNFRKEMPKGNRSVGATNSPILKQISSIL